MGALVCGALAVLPGCPQVVKPGGAPEAEKTDDTDKGEFDELQAQAAKLGFNLREAESRADAFGVGLRTKEALFSRRVNSRTWFAQDTRHKGSPFAGSDEELQQRARRVLGELGIRQEEVARATVLQEWLQGAPRGEGKSEPAAPQKGRRMALLERQVGGLPVFDSHLKLSLGKDGGIELMELHWPELPAAAIREARRLAFKARNGFRPPELANATPESVEAGILHSSAYGSFLEVQPVIRVIYKPAGKVTGKKPVLYLDRDGKPAPAPRQIEIPCKAPEPPQEGKN